MLVTLIVGYEGSAFSRLAAPKVTPNFAAETLLSYSGVYAVAVGKRIAHIANSQPSLKRPRGHIETVGVRTATFTNYQNAGGRRGRKIHSHEAVWISCRIRGFKVNDGNIWWYRIGSRPWRDKFYASADDFYNNGRKSGSLLNTPFVDRRVRICTH